MTRRQVLHFSEVLTWADAHYQYQTNLAAPACIGEDESEVTSQQRAATMPETPRPGRRHAVPDQRNNATVNVAPKSKRRFLRISLWTLLLLMLVICTVLSWLGWKVERVRKQRQVVAWVLQMGGKVFYDHGHCFGDVSPPSFPDPYEDPLGPRPKWLIKQLGIDFFADVTGVDFTDTQVSDVSPLASLTSLWELDLSNTQVSDVSPLVTLTSLEFLDLSDTQVSDVTPLATLTNLRELRLSDTQVSDVSPLASLTSLRWLQLGFTQVSDVSPLVTLTSLRWLQLSFTQVSDVSPLAALTNLEWLHLNRTQVSDAAVQRLKSALPQCAINFEPSR